MEQDPEYHTVSNLDLDVGDALLKEEDPDPIENKDDNEEKKLDTNKMLYVAVPIIDDKKLLQECHLLAQKIKRLCSSTTGDNENLPEKKAKNLKISGKHIPPFPPEAEDNPVICEICEKIFKNNIALAWHSIEHSANNKYCCHMCSYQNVSKYHIEMHIRKHEGTTRYKCEICSKAFMISTHALEHKYNHTGEKPFQCELCGKKFMHSWFLTSHRRTQHWQLTGKPAFKYDCQACNKHYLSPTGLKRHNVAHHGAPGSRTLALCEICGKMLSSREKLKFHTRIHTGYKPHSCPSCSKCFSKKEQLKEHLRVHTGERPYICKVCNRGFTQRSPLRIHERLHTGERPYICLLCDKRFISKSVLDVHKNRCELAKTLYENQVQIEVEAQKIKLAPFLKNIEIDNLNEENNADTNQPNQELGDLKIDNVELDVLRKLGMKVVEIDEVSFNKNVTNNVLKSNTGQKIDATREKDSNSILSLNLSHSNLELNNTEKPPELKDLALDVLEKLGMKVEEIKEITLSETLLNIVRQQVQVDLTKTRNDFQIIDEIKEDTKDIETQIEEEKIELQETQLVLKENYDNFQITDKNKEEEKDMNAVKPKTDRRKIEELEKKENYPPNNLKSNENLDVVD